MSLRDKLAKLGDKLKAKVFLSQLYRLTFGTEDGKLVLEDLCVNFSWSHRPTLTVASRQQDAVLASAFYEGQRSVWIYIQRKLHMSESELRQITRDAEQRADPTTSVRRDLLDMEVA